VPCEEAPKLRPRSVPSLGPTRVRRIARLAAIQGAREQLPILSMEQEIMEVVDEHDVFLLCGETGCGKTTQVPQFLLEAGFGSPEFEERGGMVGVTQPRRVAAVSTAKRVAEEVGEGVGATVGHQVRFDRAVGPGTAVKFMTDGILLRELQDDFLLRKCDFLLVALACSCTCLTTFCPVQTTSPTQLHCRWLQERLMSGELCCSAFDR
jgi:ATP-dependent RNA helicase DHX37/DHR1